MSEVSNLGNSEAMPTGGADDLLPEENDAIRFLADLGFELASHSEVDLVFKRSSHDSRSRFSASSTGMLDRAHVPMLLGQAGDKVEEHTAFTGLMIPAKGYVELTCSRLSAAKAVRAFRLDAAKLDCIHKDEAAAMPSLSFHWRDEDRRSSRRVHLSGKGGDPCIEISNASPLAMLFYSRVHDSGRARLAPREPPFLGTMKLAYGPGFDRSRLGRSSADIARSFSYELSVRNGVIIELDAPAAGPDISMALRSQNASDKIRYPRTKVQHEVAALFGFASQAIDDPPSAFLSYYQALEYFMPTAMSRSRIRDIRRELRHPDFDDNSNESMLRILRAAEGPIAAGELAQLRTLITEYVRLSELEDFFRLDWGTYFGKGPINSVPPVNLKNVGQSLAHQVADRVYQIRNRIVHAKGDPKFGDARVLLPRSAEANALIPDVLLVRLLANEAIAASQVL